MKKFYGVSKEQNFDLEYYITEEGDECGVEIVKKYNNDGIEYSETGVYSDIKYNRSRISEIVATLMRNTVTPVGLSDVMEDYF